MLMRKIIFRTGFVLGNLLAVILGASVAFVSCSPQFGGSPTRDQRATYARSGHYSAEDEEFRNQIATQVMTGGSTAGAAWRFLFTRVPHRDPPGPLPMQRLDSATIASHPTTLTRVTWFGHSASLVEIAGQNILLDPMLSIKMGPLAWVTPRRYNPQVPITAEHLPAIDAVLISHDHYDHLDYETIRRLQAKVGHFYVPLGVGAHLLAWGVPATKISELDWGDSASLPGVTIISTPARHFSGRGLLNRNSTSWSSWVLKSAAARVFYSGDGGYGPHFQAIGAQHGPFDLALVECGQYDQQWAQIHMMPEQSVRAARDVRARVMLPVHWGAFTEALHPWNEPVARAVAEAARLHQPITTPRLGESVTLDGGPLPAEPWWR